MEPAVPIAEADGMGLPASPPAHASTRAPRPSLLATSPPFARKQPRSEVEDTAHLVRTAVDGDPQAWAALVDRHSSLLYAVARAHRLNSADTEDVVQTTWLRLVEHLPQIATPASIRGWLTTTARHECLRVLRQAKKCRPSHNLHEAGLEPDVPEFDARLLESERNQALWQAVGRLSAADQALLGLLIADPPLSYEQIATAMDRPTGSIGPTRARCLSRLRRETARVGLVA